ncbi:MAG: exonuclease domain-containing protein [Chloroflexota bacterium]|nr:exonuclease domain-containing protein [Chloroflexota bacterium]MDE2941853.1 exonuclease domain-containing protein [Chloroflexota bacterium]MDE3268325.1 exonuclease domain-containing protein [Chloroflexota bacterium]
MTVEPATITGERCVALDLETTGLMPDSDEIIEVGAVRFQDDRVLDVFHTRVNPYRPLPQFIQELTGLKQSDVDSAPPFSAIAPALEEFIGSSPIVGQNVDFDLAFLAKKGLTVSAPVYDTREMASIFMPRLREYSLAHLVATLGLEHANPHRALDDAEVTARVFHALNTRAMQLDAGLLSELARLYGRARGRLAPLLQRLEQARSRAPFPVTSTAGPLGLDSAALASRLETSTDRSASIEGHNLTDETVEDFFRDGGPLSQVLDSYRQRPQQSEMALAVAHALRNKTHLIVEGGTGVGKSLAYLLPAMLFALEKGERVVVSSNTINLQEQLMAKDLPTLARALRQVSPDLEGIRFALLKGRDNYLCLRRWRQMVREEGVSADEARIAAKVMVWLQDTASGDRGEIGLSARDMPVWSRMSSADAIDCPPRTREACFLRTARERAEEAHVVVVNHALLMRDLAEGGGIIPPYDYLVIDEAHHLEEEATSQFGARLSQGDLDSWIERLEGSRGVYGETRSFMRQLLATPMACVLEPLVDDGEAVLPVARQRVGELWQQLIGFLAGHHEDGDARNLLLRVTRSTRAQPGWSDVEVAWESADAALTQVARNLERILQALGSQNDDQFASYESLVAETTVCLNLAAEIQRQLKSFVASPEDDRIYWMTQEGRSGEIALQAAPLNVGDILADSLFSQKSAVVLTSATLTTRGSFAYVRERLGLEDAEELLVDSPFDYQRAVLLCLPSDMPDPGTRGYQAAVHQAMMEIARAAGGRTLGLFTSHAALQATRSGIRSELEGAGIRTLAQGVDGTPRSLMDAFLQNPDSVLLGTASFWEGVDISGGALKALVVARLPFNVPTDPVFSARSEMFEDAFNQYAVPQAVLRFRQGFGRLIRGEEDRGVVIVLDSRVRSRPYGRAFQESLPNCTVRHPTLRELPQEIAKWIARSH